MEADKYNMKKSFIFTLILFALINSAYTQKIDKAQSEETEENVEMKISAEDLKIEEVFDSHEFKGVNLYIKKKAAYESVMLTETTKDPEGKAANYAYRALEWNETNGDEIRILNGKQLESEYSKYSLISSTVIKDKDLSEVFKIFIPRTIHYGYPWARNGSVTIGKGTFINIRTFEKKFCNYEGKFKDNPFMFDFRKPEKKEEIVLTANYNPETAQRFQEVAASAEGLFSISKGAAFLPEELNEELDKLSKQKADVVFAIDTTGSMKDDMKVLKEKWLPNLLEKLNEFEDIRIGLLCYRDYNDSYSYKTMPVRYFAFTQKFEEFSRSLNSISIKGNEGGDKPEAVYEALYSSIQFYSWRDDAVKKIILLGDAPPHEKPRGPKALTLEKIIPMAKEKNITIDCIIIPES